MQEAIVKLSQDLEAVRIQSQQSQQSQQQQSQQSARSDQDKDVRALLGELEGVDESDEKYDKLTNRQLLDVIGTAVDSAIKANNEGIKNEILGNTSESTERLGKVEQAIMALTSGLGLKEVKSKHRDFDDFKDEVEQVIQEYPGIKWEDAYMLAKSRKAGTVPPASALDREKPGVPSTPAHEHPGTRMTDDAMATMSRRASTTREGSPYAGVKGFRSLVEKTLEKRFGS